ncbi:putative p-loop containing nucleoside triphosphate hydrolase protein [Botrytis fragariae]|uniref:Putative p-loop containing nucleoside triphosphate hydrolase protein n=1 Tax=Botrytis fragariae TaxID=1964551 RepID=A0A8H6AM85_9HELO|nr:putative p-loop containing nucleoside triphosphate hydrolase protein [Botrytis fragariae]KAF5869994.1 putative p-loop containing nucleoside triphosphate hydrolase protein [Botrytis fragariae]
MTVDNENEIEGDKRSDSEKKFDGDEKVNNNKVESTMSVEDKLAQLEKRFAELESKYLGPKEKSGTEEVILKREPEQREIKDVNTTPVDAGVIVGAEESPSTEERVRVVNSKVDDDGERRDHRLNSNETSDASLKKKGCAVILRRYLQSNKGEIEVFDPDLRKLLKKILAHYPSHTFIGENVVIDSPYESFVLNWDILREEAEKETVDVKDKQARSDLRELLEMIKSGSGDKKLDSYLTARDDLIKQKSITFEALWTIFPPGTIIYGQIFLDEDQIFVVEDNFTPWPREESRRSRVPPPWTLCCWVYDYIGTVFQRRSVALKFDSFDGPKPIASLPFYPLSAIGPERWSQIEERLFKRGKLFREYCTADKDHRMYEYKGEAIFDKRGFGVQSTNDDYDIRYFGDVSDFLQSDSDSERHNSIRKSQTVDDSSVMVDFESYFRYGLDVARIGDTQIIDGFDDCHCPDCVSNEAQKELFKPSYDKMTGQRDEEWEKLQFMLCPPRVLGYILKDKQWAQLAINNLSTIKDEEYSDVLKQLHLSGPGKDGGKKKKELLFGLVQNHGMDEEELQDLVAEKGKGLVFLLYGAPGVGKTSTAQMIARAARKPLFSIGVADVGTNAREVESRLGTIFDLATKWRAILLIDEADVFLQSRSQNSIGPSAEGSALVSVFLRVLEYYRGIMFLTTNQIAQFDVAVQSRVHIALKYDKLNEEQTYKIFMGFINQLNDYDAIESADYDRIKRYAEEDLHSKEFDGRQIRNIVACARGYARAKKPSEKLKLEHIVHVVRFVEDFQRDLAGQMKTWRDQQKATRI